MKRSNSSKGNSKKKFSLKKGIYLFKKGGSSYEGYFISLGAKTAICFVCSLLIAAAIYFLFDSAGEQVVKRYYKDPEVMRKTINQKFEEFQEYVVRNEVSGQDRDELSKWAKKNTYTFFTVYDSYHTYYESPWVLDFNREADKKLVVAKEDISQKQLTSSGPYIDSSVVKEDFRNRILTFSDGQYLVHMENYSAERFKGRVLIIGFLVSLFTFILLIVVFNQRVLRRLSRITTQIMEVSGGEIYKEIKAKGHDELTLLAKGADDMRRSIIRRLENERQAFEANSQLITSMSHDIRTPLTSLIGYLDIIQKNKYTSQEELFSYIESCKNKSNQLKEMSDKLFQYFLVFGDNDASQDKEVVDADLLFQQLLTEHVAELISNDFVVDMQFDLNELLVELDIFAVRRLFDNVFSNMMKYAEPTDSIIISAMMQDENIVISFINAIAKVARKVESTKIGLKTCEKISKNMGGEFIYKEGNRFFKAVIVLPINAVKVEDEKIEEDDALEDGTVAI